MMKYLTIGIILFFMAICLFPIVPGYYGARSLSLGYSTTALNIDVNAIFINPALLAAAKYSSTGYQYQNSFMDYQNFLDDFNEILEYDLKNFESIAGNEKEALFSKVQNLFRSKSGMHGFNSSVPGFVSRGYGISVSVVKTAIINPVDNDILTKEAANVSNDNIASLNMNFLGLSYKQVSFSYALPFSKGMNIGLSLHYLKGKLTEYNRSIVDDMFTGSQGAGAYLGDCWGEADEKFSKIVMDVGISADFGVYFKIGLNMKNVAGAKIKTGAREIVLNKRVTAGLAFTPNPQWGIYLDMDITRTDLLYSGNKMQPISLGVEKGFFKNKFFLRTGFLSDLAEKYFLGSRSNVLYGLGFGFNIGDFIIDFGLGVDGHGAVNNLAVSGFFMTK